MLKKNYSNGKHGFSIIDNDGERVKLYSKTGVPYLSMKQDTYCFIGINDLLGFLEDEKAMKNYNRYSS